MRAKGKGVINSMWDAGKLKSLTHSYKRHTIQRSIRPSTKRVFGQHEDISTADRIKQSPLDYFQVFCQQTIPRIEHKIELRLLGQYVKQIKNADERREIMLAYAQRRDDLAKAQDEDVLPTPSDKKRNQSIPLSLLHELIVSDQGDGFSHHTFEDIGKFTVFPENTWKRMFPRKSFGQLEEDTYARSKTWGVMHREESMRMTNEMNRMTLPSQRNVNYGEIAHTFTNKQIKSELLIDEHNYLAIQQDFSLSLIDYMKSVEKDEGNEKYLQVRNFLEPPGIFDGIVSILVQELRRSPMRPHLCDQAARRSLIKQLTDKIINELVVGKGYKLKDFSEICQYMPKLTLNLQKSSLSGEYAELQKNDDLKYNLYLQGYHKFCKHHWRPADQRESSISQRFKGQNTGALLWGERGCGKSQILTYAVAWAHENKWINLTIPSCEAFTQPDESGSSLFRFHNGLYLQEQLAVQLLEDFKHSNEQLIREFPVDMSHYGQYDLSGMKDNEAEPCPRVWDPLRKTWSDDWKEKLFDVEVSGYKNRYENMQYRMSDRLDDPTTLAEIVNYGIDNPESSTNAVGELLEQLYHTDKYQVLMTADGYNQWFQPTKMPSFRYSNCKHLKGHIPPYDCALIRLLMRFDGNFMRNGLKMYATTNGLREFNTICDPLKDLHFFEGYQSQVPNMPLNDFRNMMNYWYFTQRTPEPIAQPEWRLENMYMETQGNMHAYKDFEARSMHVHY